MECRAREPPAYDAAFSLFPYRGITRKLLKAYKFGANRAVSRFISGCMAYVLDDLPKSEWSFDALVPVPPRAGKIRASGWDQVDRIVSDLEVRTGIPAVRCLSRLPSRSQKELNRSERAVNLAGKIRCHSRPPASVLLIDDIITTGATLSACAAALKAGGSGKVVALALCYD